MLCRRIAVLLLPLLLCLLCACNSADAQPSEDGAITEVRNERGVITGYERRYHNTEGDISRLDVYDADKNYDHFVLYDYDENRRLLQETTYKANGIGDFYYTYTYDDNGNMLEKGHYTAYEGAQRYLYDTDGNEVERYYYDSDDVLYLHEVFQNGAWQEVEIDLTEVSTE